jgi:hypothetical protein
MGGVGTYFRFEISSFTNIILGENGGGGLDTPV